MLFSLTFEIGLIIIGLLYVGDLYFDSIIDLIRVGKEIQYEEDEKKEDEERKELTKHLYA